MTAQPDTATARAAGLLAAWAVRFAALSLAGEHEQAGGYAREFVQLAQLGGLGVAAEREARQVFKLPDRPVADPPTFDFGGLEAYLRAGASAETRAWLDAPAPPPEQPPPAERALVAREDAPAPPDDRFLKFLAYLDREHQRGGVTTCLVLYESRDAGGRVRRNAVIPVDQPLDATARLYLLTEQIVRGLIASGGTRE